MRYLIQRLVPLLSLWAPILGCASGGGAYSEPTSAPSAGVYVSSSSSIGSAPQSGGSEAYIPSRGAVKADLVVRPDMAVIDFALRRVQADPQKGLAVLHASVADMERRFREAASGVVSVRMCGVSVTPTGSSSKAAAGEGETVYAVMVDGKVEVGLAPDLDYWARSRLVASLTLVMKVLADQPHKEKEKEKEGGGEGVSASARFEGPKVVVKNPDAYRAKLVAQWVKRARYSAAAALPADAPLYRIECAPPAEIEQNPISLEEVGLSLPTTCRLEAPPTGAAK